MPHVEVAGSTAMVTSFGMRSVASLQLLLFPALLLALPSSALTQTIGGVVVDRSSRLPLRLVAVQVLGDSDRTVVATRTDTAGVFYALLGMGGTYRLRFALDSATTFDSDSIAVPADGYVERQFVVSLPRAYLEFEVEKQVQTAPGSALPRYPPALKQANVEGSVLAQFVVDTSGRAEMKTFKVLKATDPGFVQAVRDVLPRMRFYPAEIGGRKVRQMVQQPFDFHLTF